MLESESKRPSEFDYNQLPDVFKAVCALITRTGIRPALAYELEFEPFNLAIDPTFIKHYFKPWRRHSRRLGIASEEEAYSDYFKHLRPKIVEKLETSGKCVPRHLFLMDDGTPITRAAFQEALLRVTRRRVPEITSLDLDRQVRSLRKVVPLARV
ncbi:hypothetical protein HA459_00495 [Rhizobium leguminosarum bv. trifolii]|uniref:hypothetical protein n=1 Tax=Rhizobium leguminosarum TaxID=384 RepID=UPI00140F564B|nr:hypothetical protein [Rhizobium leguminosarum]QIO70586.1 hypothetical protein HA459_00495 [Rhizobium leguminosarum bv. trifolii]QIO77591.1 hypothetical protein HA460_00490 [Rhizobium leguminosarum bv. trifolii]